MERVLGIRCVSIFFNRFIKRYIGKITALGMLIKVISDSSRETVSSDPIPIDFPLLALYTPSSAPGHGISESINHVTEK